jgi:hypothetical protein
MIPSEDDIKNFIAFAPGTDEGLAFVYLEVCAGYYDALGNP